MPMAAYTSALAKRVVGFTSDEKNTALKLSCPSSASVAAKRSWTSRWVWKVSTAEMPPIISSA